MNEAVPQTPDFLTLNNPILNGDVFGALTLHATTIFLSIFLLALTLTAVHAVVFVYHWGKYNIAHVGFVSATFITYFAGIIFFISVMFVSLFNIL